MGMWLFLKESWSSSVFGNIFVKPGLLLIVSVLFKVPVRLCEVVKHLTYHRVANLLMKIAEVSLRLGMCYLYIH